MASQHLVPWRAQVEAENLSRFNRNFRRWKNLSFPQPIMPLVAPDVLVETFEEGHLISSFVNRPGNVHNAQLANIGLSSYLKMLLKDNFIHADLHPGNILVRATQPKIWCAPQLLDLLVQSWCLWNLQHACSSA